MHRSIIKNKSNSKLKYIIYSFTIWIDIWIIFQSADTAVFADNSNCPAGFFPGTLRTYGKSKWSRSLIRFCFLELWLGDIWFVDYWHKFFVAVDLCAEIVDFLWGKEVGLFGVDDSLPTNLKHFLQIAAVQVIDIDDGTDYFFNFQAVLQVFEFLDGLIFLSISFFHF